MINAPGGGAGTNPYAAAIGAMAQGPKPAVIPTGALNAPAPTGIGAMPTGDAMQSPEQKAKESIMALRDLKTKYPPMANSIDGWIAQIQSVAKPGSAQGVGGAGTATPTPPAIAPDAPGPASGPGLPPLPI